MFHLLPVFCHFLLLSCVCLIDFFISCRFIIGNYILVNISSFTSVMTDVEILHHTHLIACEACNKNHYPCLVFAKFFYIKSQEDIILLDFASVCVVCLCCSKEAEILDQLI